MTRFERDAWDVVPGGTLQVFDTALGQDRHPDLL